MPVEFSHGAFRFAHAMVRGTYDVNGSGELGIIEGMKQSSRHFPWITPITRRWLVDWSRFFGPHAVNFSRRLGPSYVGALSDDVFGEKNNLARRDLFSAACAHLWSVPALNDALWQGGLKVLPSPWHDTWSAPLREWLGDGLAELAEDPPLPFFVLFEAEHDEDGMRLGLFGSAIVAETMFAALRQYLPFEKQDKLQDRIASACAAIPGMRNPFAKAIADGVTDGEIASMPQLLDFMNAVGAFVSKVGDSPAAPPG
jgi:hypothetical protein